MIDLTVCSVVGTRPHLTKLASVARAFAASPLEHVIVHSGQHYDAALADDFCVPLGLPPYDRVLAAGRRDAHAQYAYLLAELPEVYRELDPDLVLVYGDTTTTAAAALAAAVVGIPVAHVEAGLREFELSIAEEINKRVVDSVSSLFLCPGEGAAEQLRREGIRTGIVVTGDTALDLLGWPAPEVAEEWGRNLALADRHYALCTVHRAANTDEPERLRAIFTGLSRLAELGLEVIAPLHPRTRKAINRFGIALPANVTVLNPVGFFELQEALRLARCVVTDSGGLTKEAYHQRRRVILVDDQTEWSEAVREGWVRVVGADAEAIAAAVADSRLPERHSRPYGEGDAGERVVRACLDYLDHHGSRRTRTRLGAPYRRR